MKCPECGFECLPDDLECLACGVDIAAALKNQEKERIRSIEAAERKAQYELEYKKELGLISDDDEKENSLKEETPAEIPPDKDTCPKCGVERHPDSGECLRCGVIFDKIQTKEGEKPAPAPAKPSQTEVRPEDKTNEIDLNDLEIVDSDGSSETVDDIAAEDLPAEEKTTKDTAFDAPALSKTADGAAGEDTAEKDVEGQVPEKPEPEKEMAVPEAAVPDSPNVKDDPITAGPEEELTGDELPEQIESIDQNDKTEVVSLKHMEPSSKLDTWKLKIAETYTRLEPRLAKTKTQLGVLLKDKRTSWVAAAIGLVVIISITTNFGITYYKNAKIQRLQKEHEEKLEKIRTDFMSNKVEIDQKIRTLITNKLFDNAEKEIALYDIPALQNELKPLKTFLKEIRLYEKAKLIPGKEYEKNYLAYMELMGLNPDNDVYRKKTAIYKKRLANSKYSQAKAYSVSKNKNVTELGKAMVSIDKAIELYPESKIYAKLKRKLMIESLLYYEGNDDIVMAVRDDGMGKRLYSNQRKLTIWIKNISTEPTYINVQFFSMIGKDKKRYTYNDLGKKFKTKLEPGEQSVGELYFRTRTRPSKIIFSHLISGEISRSFP